MPQLYRPDEAVYVRRLADVLASIPGLWKLFSWAERYERRDRVFLAWTKWQSDGAGDVATTFGSHDFYERFVRALDDAQQGIEDVISRFASNYKDSIEPIDEIGSCNDPDQLLRMIDRSEYGVGYTAGTVGQFEIARKIAIATQILCIACADRHEWVSRDLTDITLLAAERLFHDGRVTLRVRGESNVDTGRLEERDLVISRDHERFEDWSGQPGLLERRFACRVILDGEDRLYVKSDSRPKSRNSAVIRLERGGALRDRRGLKHTVVAVETRGVLRPATREDVLRVEAIARERLWHAPLVEGPDDSPSNGLSHTHFWGRKIVGRIFTTHHGVSMEAPVEHQLTSVRDQLDAEMARDGLGHAQYKARAVTRHVLPEWFPEEIYGIPWSHEA